jgi:hypothetical protein
MFVHNEVEPYRCNQPDCYLQFRQKSYLSLHLKKIHGVKMKDQDQRDFSPDNFMKNKPATIVK